MYKKDKLTMKINEYVAANGSDTVMDNDDCQDKLTWI